MALDLLMCLGKDASHKPDRGICWMTIGMMQAFKKLHKGKRNVIESSDDEDVIEDAHAAITTSDASEGSIKKRRKVRGTAC